MKSFLLCIIKAFVITSIIVVPAYLLSYNYYLIIYLNYMNIPTDFALLAFSSCITIDILFVLDTIELFILYFLLKSLRKFKIFENLYNFLRIKL